MLFQSPAYYVDDSILECLLLASCEHRASLGSFLEASLQQHQASYYGNLHSLSRLSFKMIEQAIPLARRQQALVDLQQLIQFQEFTLADFQRTQQLQISTGLPLFTAEHLALCQRLNIEILVTCQPDLFGSTELVQIMGPPFARLS